MFTRGTDEVLPGKWKNWKWSHTFCLHLFPFPLIFITQDTRQRTFGSLSRATSFTKQALPPGEGQVQSIHQPLVCKRETFSHLCESNKYSARDSLAFLIISGALGADHHHR